MTTLEAVLKEQKESEGSIEYIKDMLEELPFEPEAYVAFTKEHRAKFKEDGRSFNDIEEWRDNCAAGQTAPIVPTNSKSNIVSLWCFEDAGDAFMFQITFCSV